MKILGMGMPELLIILAVILLIFGPKNLPKLGGAIGKTVKNLREGIGAATRPSKRPTTRKRKSSRRSRRAACQEDDHGCKKTTVTKKKAE